MDDRARALRELHEKIEKLSQRHKAIQEEIQDLQNTLFTLETSEIKLTPAPKPPTVEARTEAPKPQPKPEVVDTGRISGEGIKSPVSPPRPGNNKKTPIEDFIGKNLLNKVGIAVLVAGVAFGTKYSIDNNLINPVTRVIMGYFWGIVLNVVAMRLRRSHENFSAVLLSGGMAVMYFVTFFAYDFYNLIPQVPTFALMVIFTAFTVFAAIRYNRQVIGIIGLVGAYAVPFLLSDGSGRVAILFSFVTVVNAGILIIAFRKYWHTLYYVAFVLTWLIFIAWFSTAFEADTHLAMSLVFSTIFFVTFYAMFLSYKLIKREALLKVDLVFMLLNSFVFFGYGIAALDAWEFGDDYLGLFTILTAFIHFVACVLIHRQQNGAARDVFYFVAGMVLVFLTLAVPIQLDGNWVTFIWAAEAFLLFWIGRTKAFPIYEQLSYPLIVVTVFSLLHDWHLAYPQAHEFTYGDASPVRFLLNIHFLTTLFVTTALLAILWFHNRKDYAHPQGEQPPAFRLLTYALPLLAIFVIYAGIYQEIETYWNQVFASSAITVPTGENTVEQTFDYHILRFQTLWLIYYSAIFVMVISFLQRFYIRNRNFMLLSLTFNGLVIFFFITVGLLALAELRGGFLHEADDPFYERGIWHILIRYVGLILVIPLFYINRLYARTGGFQVQHRQLGAFLFHAAVIILLSSEMVHWLELFGVENSFKLGLSILWGLYALILIVYGLRHDQKHLRIIAIILFGITLVKLFFYDMADLSTIYKTIVMIILGALLLVASFLYNKIKRDTENEST